jgi:hypothetical protein
VVNTLNHPHIFVKGVCGQHDVSGLGQQIDVRTGIDHDFVAVSIRG